MDVKREIKIEDEFSNFTKNDALNSHLEQGLEEKGKQKMDSYSNTNFKNEIEVKSEPIYIVEEDISKEDISGLDESQRSTSDEVLRGKIASTTGLLKVSNSESLTLITKRSSNHKRPGQQRSKLLKGRVSEDLRYDCKSYPNSTVAHNAGRKPKKICNRCDIPLHDICFENFHTK
ncbi:hypothetical protein Avbf_09043 [Armadillidium vulgare]|nr:hypothetical protein Avbf_09043 [Armadillidium vulgare]